MAIYQSTPTGVGQEERGGSTEDAMQYFINSILKAVEQTSQRVVQKILMSEYERYKDVVVTSLSCEPGAYATVRFIGTNSTISVINQTGEVLSEGDTVRIYISGENLEDSYIGLKR